MLSNGATVPRSDKKAPTLGQSTGYILYASEKWTDQQQEYGKAEMDLFFFGGGGGIPQERSD